jgi:L-alanine-DL-glutamate epimerase-like enolase superfamily enzyme
VAWPSWCAGAVDIVQPDASRAGGISSVRQVAELRPWMIVIR